MKIFSHLKDGIKLSTALIYSKFYRIFNKEKIYLIGERKDQCQDNGYHLFKYIRENHKDDKFYYCITKDSNQLHKIENLENIVYYKSFKHYLYYVLSEKLVCAHIGSCTPDTAMVWSLENKNIINKKRVFIQHGITKELIPSLMYKNTKFNAFICGAKAEYEYVKRNFGYPEKNVLYLGFSRFDELHDYKNKNQILVMPTWRKWFGMDEQDEILEEEFLKSDYFKNYNQLINSDEINRVLEQKNIKLIFYPHNEMQRYIHLFKSKFNNVEIADNKNYDVQTLLKQSKLLITDYSSIAFDFAYMKKPIIYYQFDEEKYFNQHYAKGYFEYEKNGFGRVIKNFEELVSEIKIFEKNNFNNFNNRAEKFFEINDKNNSIRIYKNIKS